MCILDVLNVDVNRTIFFKKQRNVRITNFWYCNWQITRMGQTSRKDGLVVLRHGRTYEKYVGRYYELANKKTEQLYTVSRSCLHDHNFKKEELEKVVELSDVCSQIVLKCFYLARIDRPDILWSVNKLARAVTTGARVCDRRLARLISKIHHTYDHRQHCRVCTTAQHCRLGLFQNSDFADDLEDSKSTSRWFYVFSDVEHLFP